MLPPGVKHPSEQHHAQWVRISFSLLCRCCSRLTVNPCQAPCVPWGCSAICLCAALFCATSTFHATQVLQQTISCFVQALNQPWADWHQDKLKTLPETCRSAALPKGTCTREQHPQSCAVLSPLPAGSFLLLFGGLLIFCQITLSDYKYFSLFFSFFLLDNYPVEL